MNLLFYAALSIVAVNIFAALIYYYLHRGAGLAISLVGTVLLCIGLTYATINDVPASKPAPDITTDIETPAPTTTFPTIHPSLDPSIVSRGTPSPAPATTPSKRPAYTNTQPRHAEKKAPVHRRHFDDRENDLQTEQRGTEPGAGGCDDIAAGGCK
jgi:hypothetical protein